MQPGMMINKERSGLIGGRLPGARSVHAGRDKRSNALFGVF